MNRPHRPGPVPRAAGRPSASLRRAGAAAVLAVGAVAVTASAASAHVTVDADDARQGASDTVLSFRVPDEDAAASTVKVAITFPRQTPVGQVRPAPKPGWTVQTTRTTYDPPVKSDDGEIRQGVSQVVFTAASPAAGIAPGGFDTFQVLVGPLPRVASLAFPTVQTYSSGRSVAWIQPVTDPADEPEAPAPVLHLLAAGPAGSAAASATGTAGDAAQAGTAPATGDAAGEAASARRLAIGGLVVGVLGLLAGAAGVAVALRKTR